MLPTTDPDAPAERTVSSARKCQLAPVVALVWVQIVVEPSLRAKVMAGPFRPGSELEPKASMLMAARVAREPAERAVVPSNRLLAPLVDQAVTRPALTCNGAAALLFERVMLTAPELVTSNFASEPATFNLALRKSGAASAAMVLSE